MSCLEHWGTRTLFPRVRRSSAGQCLLLLLHRSCSEWSAASLLSCFDKTLIVITLRGPGTVVDMYGMTSTQTSHHPVTAGLSILCRNMCAATVLMWRYICCDLTFCPRNWLKCKFIRFEHFNEGFLDALFKLNWDFCARHERRGKK